MSANRLLVIGDGSIFDDVASVVASGQSWAVARCASPRDLLLAVATARLERFGGDLIDQLDIHDHSVNNGMQLGKAQEILFDVAGGVLVGATLATALGAHLRATAQVRLLGCDVAFESGEPAPITAAASDALLARHLDRRFLLVELAEALGAQRVVFGTNCNIDYSSFTPDGLGRVVEKMGLFSSLAAIHVDPCELNVQGGRLAYLRKHQRPFE